MIPIGTSRPSRVKYGEGTLTYEATVVTDTLQREIIRDVLQRTGLTSGDQNLPEAVRGRHGRNSQGRLVHYYLNFSDIDQTLSYPYGSGKELLTSSPISPNATVKLNPWGLAIIEER